MANLKITFPNKIETRESTNSPSDKSHKTKSFKSVNVDMNSSNYYCLN